jgi:acyl-CoA synthetase (AMP-forming)/AMP-acid ligase II
LLIEHHRLVDENDEDVPIGEPGEALLKGPLVTEGYHHNPEANASGFTKDGWYRTGDVMQFGENSKLLYVVGRTKVSLFLCLNMRIYTKRLSPGNHQLSRTEDRTCRAGSSFV